MSVGFSVSKYGLGRCPAFLDRNMTVSELGPTIGAFQVAIVYQLRRTVQKPGHEELPVAQGQRRRPRATG